LLTTEKKLDMFFEEKFQTDEEGEKKNEEIRAI
jgi:hypothetical protein